MTIGTLYNKIALISPYIEVLLKHIYWKNVDLLGKYNPNRPSASKEQHAHVEFQEIINWLRAQGVEKGAILVVHSSYSELESTGLDANHIIDKLLELVGPSGTLAMPAIRKYKDEPKGADKLTVNMDSIVCTYNVRKTMVESGVLPFMMLRRKNSIVSYHPFNPMVAIGPMAEAMMKHNLDGDRPSPHGPNSSWKFCYDHNAFVVGLGVDLDHYNTISHINEEAFGNWKWSDEEWYRERKFIIIDEDGKKQEKVVRERKPQWGMLRFAELHANRDRNKSGLIKRTKIGGVIPVCIESAKDYVDYLQENNKKGKFYYL